MKGKDADARYFFLTLDINLTQHIFFSPTTYVLFFSYKIGMKKSHKLLPHL